jgi:hypothetical protein
MRARGLAIAAVLAVACGGDRATAPTPPRPSPSPSRGLAAGATVTVVRGDTGAAVPGASVTVAGRAYVADASGVVRIEAAAEPGALVDVTAPSVLDRQTVVAARPAARLVLWPRATESGVDEDFTMTIVYTSATLQGGPPGGDRLRRVPADARTVVIVPASEILDDDAAHGFHAEGVARMTAATRGAVTYALARERPASGVIFDVRVAPSDPFCEERVRAFTRLSSRGFDIAGGEVVYCSWDAARSPTVVHELGHTFGLRHSSDRREVMFGTFVRGRGADFTARESEVMALMLERRAGNRFPDSDRDLPASNAMDTAVIVCH